MFEMKRKQNQLDVILIDKVIKIEKLLCVL